MEDAAIARPDATTQVLECERDKTVKCRKICRNDWKMLDEITNIKRTSLLANKLMRINL